MRCNTGERRLFVVAVFQFVAYSPSRLHSSLNILYSPAHSADRFLTLCRQACTEVCEAFEAHTITHCVVTTLMRDVHAEFSARTHELSAPTVRETKDAREAREAKLAREQELFQLVDAACQSHRMQTRLVSSIVAILRESHNDRAQRAKELALSVSATVSAGNVESVLQSVVAREIERELRELKANLSLSLPLAVAAGVAEFVRVHGLDQVCVFLIFLCSS